MDKTIRKYSSFEAMKNDEYRERQALPQHARLDAAGELSRMQYQWMQDQKAEIDRGMADITKGRLTEFNAGRIMAQGKKLSASRAKSAPTRQRD
jgi:predicted transcriptional regulator